jgi:hypothetical protein
VHFTDPQTRDFVESRMDRFALQAAAEETPKYDGSDR